MTTVDSTAPAAESSTPAVDAPPPLPVRLIWNALGPNGADIVHQLSTNFYDLVYNDPDPAHAGFRNQFVDTPIELSIHNQQTYFVQKFGGPEFFGGMVKESSFILEMHRNLFHCTPGFLNIWLEMFETALKKTDLGPRSAEIRDSLLRWSSGFGKAMINAPDGSAHPRANNKPQ